MNNENDKDYAFPYEVRNGAGEPVRDHYGMTMHNYFAGQALVGLLSSHPDTMQALVKITGVDSVSKLAHKIAAAMIIEGEK